MILYTTHMNSIHSNVRGKEYGTSSRAGLSVRSSRCASAMSSSSWTPDVIHTSLNCVQVPKVSGFVTQWLKWHLHPTLRCLAWVLAMLLQMALPTRAHPKWLQVMAQIFGSQPPTWETPSSDFLACDWSSPDCCRHLGDEPANAGSLYLSLPWMYMCASLKWHK